MEGDLPRQDASRRDGLPQRVLDKIGVQAIADRPAQDTSGMTVADDAEIRPALTSVQVGDIGKPSTVPAVLIEAPLDEIPDGEQVISADRCRRCQVRGLIPVIPSARISFAIVLRGTATPASCRSAWILGAP